MSYVVHKSDAIVLLRRDSGERDILIDVYTKDSGHIKLLARGAKDIKSKFAPNLLEGASGELWWAKGKRYGVFINANMHNIFGGKYEDFQNIRLSLDFLCRMTKTGEKDERIFAYTAAFLQKPHNFLDFIINILPYLGWEYKGKRTKKAVGEFIEFHAGVRLPYLNNP